MSFLVRCPHSSCRRPKRVDGVQNPRTGAPVCWCKECRIYFYAWLDGNGVAMAQEREPCI